MKKSNPILNRINEIRETHEGYYTGKVVRISPLLDKNNRVIRGSKVITPRGAGEILSHLEEAWDGKPSNRIHVQLKKFPKAFKITELTQLAIYHEPSSQFLLLSPQCYSYIGETEQLVRYRVTKRKYAMLTDNYKKEAEKYDIINNVRNGSIVLKNLQRKGFVIKHPKEEVLSWEDIKTLMRAKVKDTLKRWFQFRKTTGQRVENIIRDAWNVK